MDAASWVKLKLLALECKSEIKFVSSYKIPLALLVKKSQTHASAMLTSNIANLINSPKNANRKVAVLICRMIALEIVDSIQQQM